MIKVANIIRVQGLVQGVGFRPFVYKLALRQNLKGWVENRNDGVLIKAEGDRQAIEKFRDLFIKEAPPASKIVAMEIEESLFEGFDDFHIVRSENISDEVTEICPDIAVCEDCLEDMQTQKNRIAYPFINCTNCGPRFTIIRDLPYDREKTTMHPFKMCSDCHKEYVDILDRRFHAQPVACSVCGPEYELRYNGKTVKELNIILETATELISGGKIIAIKGIGGFFFSCDATNQEAVKRLRTRKNREGKPFAVMFSNIHALQQFAEINEAEKESLLSWRRPIVLLKQKKNLLLM
ncbi:MAG: carbamoyltransferase HypF [Chloroflexia bacterium]|nr:carbamoyltransferase HypF [Chloroflexia bacterium]